jgi:hypothetical protein
MPADLKTIINNVKDIYASDSSVKTLMDFERVLDEVDLYVFRNWKKGELVDGPKYEKYFVTCTFMWPRKLMPDPRGGERLLEYGCEVRYKRELLEYPIRVKDPKDFKPGTKVPKLGKAPVWLVEVTVPKKLMQDISQGSIELENETIDVEDIKDAYDTGASDDIYKTPGAQSPETQAAQAANPELMQPTTGGI